MHHVLRRLVRRVFAGRRGLRAAFLLAGALTAAAPAQAADGKLVFGFTLNSATTPVMTAMLKELQNQYQPEVGLQLTPLPGNSSGFAIEAAHRAPADGRTILLTSSSVMTLQPHLRKLADVDPVADFIPVGAIAEFTAAFVVGKAVPAEVTSVSQYVQWLRQNPMQFNYGLPGLGTALHYVGMALARKAELPLKAVAYKTTGSMVDDLRSGSLPAALLLLGAARDAARDGSVRLLAVTSAERWAAAPELPTMLELGVAEVTMVESFGLFLPARTPPAIVQSLGDAVRRAARSPAVLSAIAEGALRPVPATIENYPKALNEERSSWGEIVKRQRISIDG